MRRYKVILASQSQNVDASAASHRPSLGNAGHPIAGPAPKKKVKSIQVQGPWWQGGPGLEPPGFPPGINPQQGFNPLRQGFNPLQGINPLQPGFNPFQVFSPFQALLQQGYNPFQQGFNQLQGINPLPQGFNQFQQGFDPNFGMRSSPSQGPAGNDSASESAEDRGSSRGDHPHEMIEDKKIYIHECVECVSVCVCVPLWVVLSASLRVSVLCWCVHFGGVRLRDSVCAPRWH